MEELFNIAGISYHDMEEDSELDISDKNIKIKTFNHKSGKIEYKKILKLIRKQNSTVYEIQTLSGDILLKATGDHRIYSPTIEEYTKLKDVETIDVLTDTNQILKAKIIRSKIESPILDIEVEDNENYFSNGILSHNSGGNALKFFSSQRLEVRRKGIISEGEEKTGIESQVKVVKNKIGPPFRTAIFNIMFGTGIDAMVDLLNVAVDKEIITKSGAWFAYEGQQIGQGSFKASQWLKDNDHIAQEIRTRILEAG
jgi:hypothetical protein